MLQGPQACATVAAWLAAVHHGSITASDAVNACEVATGVLTPRNATWMAVVEHVTPRYAPRLAVVASGQTYGLPFGTCCAIALSDSTALLLDGQSRWSLWHGPHAIAVTEASFARRSLYALIESAHSELAQLDLVGDRTEVDAQLRGEISHLPPTMSNRARADVSLSQRILTVAQFALESAHAPASRSQDERRVVTLQSLVQAARELLCAAATA